MDLEKYWELLREVNRLYQAGQFEEVINFLEDKHKEYPYGRAALMYSRICAAAKLEQYDLSIKLIREILDEGGWYSEIVLRESPSLQPLQEIPEFQALLKISVERAKEAMKEEHDITVIPDNTSPPYPLMLTLHAGSGFVEEEFEFWKIIIDQGYILGMPRSTNLFWSGRDSAYWPDHETAANQIKTYINKLKQEKLLDLERIVVGGLSQGAELAVWLAVSGEIPVRGFIVIAPGGQWMNELEKWQTLIKSRKKRDLRGMIILGEKDEAVPHENIKKLVKMLNDGNIPCQFIEYPNLGHWYPPDFADILTSFIQA
ncbi:MAG: alpha/beta hydrolase [Promethearchaeota archaeon]